MHIAEKLKRMENCELEGTDYCPENHGIKCVNTPECEDASDRMRWLMNKTDQLHQRVKKQGEIKKATKI